jgi:hypothetical protein
MPRPSALRRRILPLFLAAAALFAFARWRERRLPPPQDLLAEVRPAPTQGPTDRRPFEFSYKGKRCFVRPVASYEIQGLVVSHNDIHSVADIYHDSTSVDTRDLCIAWGRNLDDRTYLETEFWSGPWTCYARWPARVVFDGAALSNNHLITDRPELRKRLEHVHVGDQVRLTGLLVDYRMEDWGDFWRRTSTVRNDSDCEVIFFDDLEVLRANVPLWHAVARTAKALLIALPVAWLMLAALEARRGPTSLGKL